MSKKNILVLATGSVSNPSVVVEKKTTMVIWIPEDSGSTVTIKFAKKNAPFRNRWKDGQKEGKVVKGKVKKDADGDFMYHAVITSREGRRTRGERSNPKIIVQGR